MTIVAYPVLIMTLTNTTIFDHAHFTISILRVA